LPAEFGELTKLLFKYRNDIGDYQMPVTLNPTRRDDRQAEKFITEAGKQSASANKKPLLVRFDAGKLERIALAAKRLISRSAFVASSTVRELERMEA
jgi:hypothetical protein